MAKRLWSSLAHQARWGLLLARTDPDLEKHAGITAFILDMTLPGVEVRPPAAPDRGFPFQRGIPHRGADLPTRCVWARRAEVGEIARHDPGLRAQRWRSRYVRKRWSPPDGTLAPSSSDTVPLTIRGCSPAWSIAWIGGTSGQVSERHACENSAAKGLSRGADGSMEKLYHSEHRQRVQELLIDMGGEDAVAFAPGDTWAGTVGLGLPAHPDPHHRRRGPPRSTGTRSPSRMLGLPRDKPVQGRPRGVDVPRELTMTERGVRAVWMRRG